MMRNILLLLAPLCLLFYGCPGGECVDNPLLPYQGSFNIKPEKSVYQLGDTMIFHSKIAIKDLFSEAEPEKYEVASQISVGRLDSSDNYPSNNFLSYIVLGSQYPLTHRDSVDLLDTNLANFIYEKGNDSLRVNIQIRLLRRGIYFFSPSTAGLKIFGNKKCEQFSILKIICNNEQTNFYLFEKYRGPGYDKTTAYCFEVK